MSWMPFTILMPVLWFSHWGTMCAIFLRQQGRPVVLALPLSFLGPIGALVAYSGTTRAGNRLAESAALNPGPIPDDDLPT